MNGEIRSPPKEEELKLKGFAYLLKLEADQNHNRYYRMVQEGDRFKIEMGRIGARPVCMVRPMTLWDTTYQKKIKEGYEDRSEFCDVSVEKNQNYKPIPDFVVAELMEYLQKEANQILEKSYTISWTDVNKHMLKDAQSLINQIGGSVESCNQILLKLFVVIPRKMQDVQEMLAHTHKEIPEIIQREQDLLDVLRFKCKQNAQNGKIASPSETILDMLGITIRECTYGENQQILTLTSIIGKIISVKLVGNGISLILVSNILSSYPSDSANIYEVLMKGKKTYIAGLHLFFLLILITALFIFTVWLQDTEKKIPVTYSGKLQGKSTFKGVSTNTIPIKLCPGGVVPIIFASSLISFPILIAQIAGAKQNAVLKLLNSGYWFNTSKPWYTFGALIYLVLIFAFSYFYTEITMNPEEIANNIKKSGGNIAGIRAGSSTAEYLRKQMKYLIAIGSFCLCIIAIIPFIVSGLTGLSRLSFFGTSIIITVSVILETKKLILSKTQENYYMNRVKKGGLFRG